MFGVTANTCNMWFEGQRTGGTFGLKFNAWSDTESAQVQSVVRVAILSWRVATGKGWSLPPPPAVERIFLVYVVYLVTCDSG